MSIDQQHPQLRPICFMIMPYGRKPTGAPTGTGPVEVDFDALWERALRPLLEEDLGFEAVRADQDLGPLIIKEMIERLALSDVVVADITAPNANVYYEVGVRRAAHRSGCVLVAAEWAQPVFDLAQVRQLRYPLAEGNISTDTAAAIRARLRGRIEQLIEGQSLVYEILPGYPAPVDSARVSTFRKRVSEISAILAQVESARRAPKNQRRERALAVRDRHRKTAVSVPGVALELIALLRDSQAWEALIELVESLPAATRELGAVREQYYLAKSRTGDHEAAIAVLEELIRTSGDSSERRGLLGGRYKRLYQQATDAEDLARYLSAAIAEYDRGMRLDLNDYFPTSNLPRLLRTRGHPGTSIAHASLPRSRYSPASGRDRVTQSDPWIVPPFSAPRSMRATSLRRARSSRRCGGCRRSRWAPSWRMSGNGSCTMWRIDAETTTGPDPDRAVLTYASASLLEAHARPILVAALLLRVRTPRTYP